MRLAIRHASIVVVAAGVVSGSALGQAPAGRRAGEPSSAEEVIARYIAALGGRARLESVPRRHMVTKVRTQVNGVPVVTETETHFVAPNKVRVRGTSDTMGLMEMGFDGRVGWMTLPVGGTRELVGTELQAVRMGIPGVPSWANARGLALLGRRTFEGTPMHAIAWTSDTIGRVIEYFDVRTGLRRAKEVTDPRSGKTITNAYSEYTTRDGYTMAMRAEIRLGSDVVSTAITTIFEHRPIAASVFTPPASLRRKGP